MGRYHPGQPASGPGVFFGRELLIRNLVEGLGAGRNVAVIGGPGMGKTSVFAQVASQFRLRWSRDPDETKIVPIVLDVSQWSLDAKSAAGSMWKQIYADLTHPRVVGEQTPRVEFELARGVDPLEYLRERLATLVGVLRGTSGWARYLLFLDNADCLSEHDHESLLRFWIELHSDDALFSPVAIAVAGGRLLRESMRERESPLRGVRLLPLKVFRDSEAKSLVKRGFPQLPEHSIENLLSLSGKHPWLLVRLLAALESEGEESDIRAMTEGLLPELSVLWSRIWEEFDMKREVTYRGAYAAPEHALIQLMIDSRNTMSVKHAENELAIRPLKEYAELLEYMGVTESNLVAGESAFHAGSELFNSWYSERIRQ